jgi:hypothetical protein
MSSAKGRESVTAAGDISGGYEDFRPGTRLPFPLHMMLPPPRAVPSALFTKHKPTAMVGGRPCVVHRNWRPVASATAEWAYVAKQQSQSGINTLFLLDCGADGDCLFHVLAVAFNQAFQTLVFSMEGMRAEAAEQLNASNVDDFVRDYHGRTPSGWGEWPVEARVRHCRTVIRTSGPLYWGETGTLQRLLLHSPYFKTHGLGFAVITTELRPLERGYGTPEQRQAFELQNKRPAPAEIITKWEPRAETHILRLPNTRRLMLLYCQNEYHWQLLGYAPDVAAHKVSAGIASTFPIDCYPAPLFPFLRAR